MVPACSGGHFVFVWSVYGRERKNGASTCDLAEITSLLVDGALVLARDELSLRANFGRTRVMDVETCRDVDDGVPDSHAKFGSCS